MPTPSLLRSRIYRVACASSLALALYVVARAPLWNEVMAGASVQLESGQVALAPPAWECTDRPHVCSTTIGGAPLVAKVGSIIDRPITCTATFKGETVPCTVRLWYAPRAKPFLEIGPLPNVSFRQAMWERPWRLLDAGLLGECGPLHLPAGVGAALLLALGACAWVRRSGAIWRIAQVAVAMSTFVLLSAMWVVCCVLLGYID